MHFAPKVKRKYKRYRHSDSACQQRGAVVTVLVKLIDPRLVVDDRAAKLSPGMSVQAEVVIGGGSVIDYLWSPVAQVGKER